MSVPAKLLGHHAHPNLVIVHLAERDVAVRFGDGAAKRERIEKMCGHCETLLLAAARRQSMRRPAQ
jgi:hypothetical protein